MSARVLALTTGDRLVLNGTREEIDALIRRRTLTQDDGLRTVTTADGEEITFNIGAVAANRAAVAERRGVLGFQ